MQLDRSNKGESPLSLAANGGHLEIMKLLIEKGCYIHEMHKKRNSCLLLRMDILKW